LAAAIVSIHFLGSIGASKKSLARY